MFNCFPNVTVIITEGWKKADNEVEERVEKIGMAFGEREKCYLAAIQCEETQPDSQLVHRQTKTSKHLPKHERGKLQLITALLPSY